MSGAKRVALYMRVSTGSQDLTMQRMALAAAAERFGWQVVAEFKDDGISGAKGRDKRPGLDALCKGITRRSFDLVAAWSLDRLARSLHHATELGELLRDRDVGLYLDRQGIDTTTAAGRAMFGMLGVFAEFERELIRERTVAGLAKAREKGTRSGKPIGRPTLPGETVAAVRAALAAGRGIRETARIVGCAVGTVHKLAASPAM